MTERVPLVLTSGQIQQLQSGDDLACSITGQSVFIYPNSLYVNVDRVDTYVPDGSTRWPYKTIQSAINAITDASYTKKYYIEIMTQTDISENVVMKSWIRIRAKRYTIWYGANPALPTIHIPGTVDGELGLESFFIVSTTADPTKNAILHEGAVGSSLDLFFTNVFNIDAGSAMLISNGGDVSIVNSYISGTLYAVDMRAGATVSAYTGLFQGGGAYDILVAATAELACNGGCTFYGNGPGGAGTITLSTPASAINNDSNVTGKSVKDALNNLAPKANPIFSGTIGTALTASRNVETDGSGNLSAVAKKTAFNVDFETNVANIKDTSTAAALGSSGLVAHSDHVHKGSGGSSAIVMCTANTTTAYTVDLANGTCFNLTLNGDCTFTFPSAGTAGVMKEFWIYLNRDATPSRAVTWDTDVRWPMNIVPALDGTASTLTIFHFTQLGNTARWYGEVLGMGFPI